MKQFSSIIIVFRKTAKVPSRIRYYDCFDQSWNILYTENTNCFNISNNRITVILLIHFFIAQSSYSYKLNNVWKLCYSFSQVHYQNILLCNDSAINVSLLGFFHVKMHRNPYKPLYEWNSLNHIVFEGSPRIESTTYKSFFFFFFCLKFEIVPFFS